MNRLLGAQTSRISHRKGGSVTINSQSLQRQIGAAMMPYSTTIEKINSAHIGPLSPAYLTVPAQKAYRRVTRGESPCRALSR